MSPPQKKKYDLLINKYNVLPLNVNPRWQRQRQRRAHWPSKHKICKDMVKTKRPIVLNEKIELIECSYPGMVLPVGLLIG